MKADVVVYDRNGQIALIVEAKKKSGTSGEWAKKWRRNIFAHGRLPDVKFFMFALPDHFYLWKNAGNLPEAVEPTFEIDAKPILEPYLDKTGISLEEVSPQSFELIISTWLNSLLISDILPNQGTETEKWIIQSGLLEAVNGGYIKHEIAL